jgi:CheY-like chemotaxis protein
MKMLIIEDEKALAEVMRLQFEDLHYTVSVVMDGAEALPQAQKIRPNIILLDLLLPHKDGYEILEELKSDPDLKAIPVIILSNLDQDEDIKKALKLGATDYYVKSQHPIKEIVEKVQLHVITSGGAPRPKSKKAT